MTIQGAIAELQNLLEVDDVPFYYKGSIKKVIETIQADRPQGEWIDTTSGEHWKCSVCGCRAPFFLYDWNRAVEWLSEYCPNCGARMKGVDNETN